MSRRRALLLQAPTADPLDGYTWQFRFESTTITGLVDNDDLTTWPDSSGNDRDATAAGPAPVKYRTGVTSTGLPVARFTGGVATRMVTGSITALSQPNTVFVVGSHTATSFSQLYDGIASGNRHALFSSTSNMEIFGGASLAGGSKSADTIRIIAATYNGASSKLWVEGGSATTGNAGLHTLTGLTIGNRFAAVFASAGDIAALLVHNSAMSNADINVVGNALAAKYGPSWSTAS